MKRVRFITPARSDNVAIMNDSDCHSPQPFIQTHLNGTVPELSSSFPREIVYSLDPVRRFEGSDCSPYPLVTKTDVPIIRETSNRWTPSTDLELSMLDSNNEQPRKPTCFTPVSNLSISQEKVNSLRNVHHLDLTLEASANVLSPVENTKMGMPPNTLNRDDNFFITRGGFKKDFRGSLPVQMNKLSLSKENDNKQIDVPINKAPKLAGCLDNCNLENSNCRCHHCIKQPHYSNFNTSTPDMLCGQNPVSRESQYHNCTMQVPLQTRCNCACTKTRHMTTPQHCNFESMTPKHPNSVDKKAWVLEKYKQVQNNCMDVEKQMNVSKEKREPTIDDLLKIIKLQNKQLQLLHERVDKLVSSKSCAPMQTFATEGVSLETVDHDQHKISIGVMTSLEMVHTSAIINKEQYVKQTYNNAQIQCNRSAISIKEVVQQPVNLNFLDGIMPVGKPASLLGMNESQNQHIYNLNDEKTFNEISLYNVQLDNATTPLMSPEQSLYLDVRDYSGSDSSSDHSNVGWTYYNKVMTHVNGMLQDSDMPSSASAAYRNTRQCLQMQIEKTNISVTKRVTFGDDPLVAHQPQLAVTDTSMRMYQLAAKYLKSTPAPTPPTPRQNDMSFATRNYMERHKLVQGQTSKRVPADEMPRFLDVTSLKQQPKLL